ncbi:MAG: AraC family transcriptional regulator [Lachnospiraceae bacterium]|nr:AraC family transcriptional regulator [Lachnospiraceae bacterium]
MKNVHSVEFHTGSREEALPDFAADFPYIASRAELGKYIGRTAPWHWHRAVEIFYMKSGVLEYETPAGKIVFPAGSGGMVNANVLHMTRAVSQTEETVQLLHIFDASLLAGEQGSRIERKYIAPIVNDPQMEMIPLFPDHPEQYKILGLILDAFCLPEDEFGYEMKLREVLTQIWLLLFAQYQTMPIQDSRYDKSSDKIKQMLIYVHEHYPEKISISALAAAAYLSERECFRAFRDCLHMTPVEYIQNYRLQIACQMLAKGKEPVTVIGRACGLGSSSYFGKVFRAYAHCTPTEYRKKWGSQ